MKIPPLLEYLLDSAHGWHYFYIFRVVGQKHGNCTTSSLYSKTEKSWSLINELEQAWTGVEEIDRAIISKLAPRQTDREMLVMVCPLRYTIQKLKDFVGVLYDPSTASMDSQ